MAKVLDSSLVIGSDFYNLLESLDTKNAPVDDAVEKYLDNNPEGLSFSYDGKEYIITKKGPGDPAQLHMIQDGKLVLKDPQVQMNSKYTPDGSIELGGVVDAGMRIYIFRSGENNEEVLAYASKDGNYVEDRDKSVLLYTGERANDKPSKTENPVQSTPVQSTPVQSNPVQSTPVEPNPVELNPVVSIPVESSPVEQGAVESSPIVTAPTEGVEVIYPEYIYLGDMPDGEYQTIDGLMFDSAGGLLAKSWYDDGTYKIKDGAVYREFSAVGGQTFDLPVSDIFAEYCVDKPYIDQNGQMSKGPVDYEFLRELGVSTQDIDLPYILPGSEAAHSKWGEITVRSADDSPNTNLLISGSGENEAVIGWTNMLEEGVYLARKNPAGNMILFKEHVHVKTIGGVEQSIKYLVPYEVYSGDMLVNSPVLTIENGIWQEINSTSDMDFLSSIGISLT